MNKTKLKNYAPQARRDFIQTVTDRAAYFGLTAKKIEPITEQGDVAIIAGRAHSRSIAPRRRALEERIKRQGFEQVMEATAYTWFNRLVAIRFMELHGYLNHGYRVLSHTEGKDTPEILEQAEHVDLPGLDKDKVIEMKLEGTREAALYRMLLIAQCNALHAAMPFLFERIDDETELLLPDNLLHSDSLIRKLVGEIDEQDWQEVEIIGWLYQFYISEKKDEVIGKVVRSEDIPAATQLFTPKWIVKYMTQNSVGRMWLQTYPHSGLRAKMEYYIEPAEQTGEVKAELARITPASIDPETITVLDPACGSGHILVEAYDLLKEIYLERGYRLRDIPRLVLAKNLFGLDIDDRAAQLAGFALLMKARADDRRVLETTKHTKDTKDVQQSVSVNVYAIQESAGLNAAELADALLNVKSSPRAVSLVGEETLWSDMSVQPALAIQSEAQAAESVSREDVIELIELFEIGKTLGSLISIPESLAQKLPSIAQLASENLHSGDLHARAAASAMLPFVQQAEVLARKYDCVIANPPYMGEKYFEPNLKSFVGKTYVAGKGDLYACFILRNLRFCWNTGFTAMITIPNWMFLSTFEKLRKQLIETQVIESLIHNGRGIFGSDFGTCTFAIRNASLPKYKGKYKRLFEKQGSVANVEELDVRFKCNEFFRASSSDFQKIPREQIAYWVSNKVRRVFEEGVSLSTVNKAMTGMRTGDNERFLRYWHEVSFDITGIRLTRNEAITSHYKWFPYNKGGEFCKWYGNNLLVVNWKDNGREIKALTRLNYPNLGDNLSWKITNEPFYFSDGITWGGLTISSVSFRWSDTGALFDSNKGAMIFPSKENHWLMMGFLLSKPVEFLLNILNPTLSTQNADIDAVPFIKHRIIESKQRIEAVVRECIEVARRNWNSFEASWDFQTFPLLRSDLKAATVEESFNNWQALCSANIKRMQELETENNRLFIEAYGLQDELTPEVPEDQITLARADREADIKRLISYAVGCMMGRYSLDKPGLIYAHSGNEDFDHEIHKIHEKRKKELSCDSCVSWFDPDPDGIVPVMEAEWFADDAANRFIEFIGVAWSKEHLEDNLKFIAESLGTNRNEQPRDTIRRYVAAGFFKDHLKTYKKRPIYWLFASGKQRAFQCLVYLHRYNEGTLSRMRTEYVIPLQGKIAARIEQLTNDIQNAASTSHRRKLEKERDALRKQQAELQAFDEKLRHYADKRISLDLDDGVKVNYGKFGDLLAEVRAVTGGSED